MNEQLRGAALKTALSIGMAFAYSQATASCGSSNCFLVVDSQEGAISTGLMNVDLSYRYIPQDRKLQGSDPTNQVLVPKVDFENGVLGLPADGEGHEEQRTINILGQLDLNYGVTPDLGVGVTVPFYNERQHEHTHLDTAEFTKVDGTTGMGDIVLRARYALYRGTRDLVVAGAGIKLPSGEYRLRDSDNAINEPTIQPGTGSYDYLFSILHTHQWTLHSLDTFASLQYRLNTENDLKYEFGDALTANAGLDYRIANKLLVSGQINARYAKRDRFLGQDVPSTGSTMVYATPGIRVESSDQLSLYAHLQLPVYQRVNDVNLVPRYQFMFGLSYAFSTL
ncbi:MAG: hypothetical protein GC138_05260 [Gammaproteobacteria bacterium]|nr:hypothetical protein [Gammaproteobacteria bacterium]